MTDLTDMIVIIVRSMMDMETDEIEAAIDAASDDLATGDKTDDAMIDSILDGIRWGHRAAVTVDLAGGTIVRVIVPGGLRVTHEWDGQASEDCRDAVMETVGRALVGDPA